MYLVGLPRIAADLNASEAQLHIAFSVYLAGWRLRCYLPVKWPIVQEKACRHTRRGAIYYRLGVLFTG